MSEYLLGSRDEELRRLAFQHRAWAEHAFALWRRAGFGYAGKILDLGCGPGFTTIDLAHLVGPAGCVLAVDGSQKFLEHLRARSREQGLENIETVQADVHDVELPAESLDGAYARWLFCYLERPEAVVSRVAAALRPGASFAVTDYFNYGAFTFAPRSDALSRVAEAVRECWKRQGGDLDIQGRMPGLMLEAGLEVSSIASGPRIARPGSPLWMWPETFFRGFLPTLEEEGLVGPELRDAFWRDWRARSDDPGAFLFLPPNIDVVGTRR